MNNLVILYFLQFCALINCNIISKNLDCGLYYWSHVHELMTTCVISNRDMKNDAKKITRIQETLESEKNNLIGLMINSTINTVIPTYISDFPVLENLRIQNTDLKKFAFNGTSNIAFMFLGYNKISEIDQNAFNGLLNLKILYLNNNKLSQIHNKAFKQLSNLQVIWLNDNHLKAISSETFSSNINLQRIKLQFNKINFIGKNAFNIQGTNNKLRNLDLRGNICIDIETFIYNITEVITRIKLNCNISSNNFT
ncbi:hypothetical protein ACKWTF_012140 [Chironomus riparius]